MSKSIEPSEGHVALMVADENEKVTESGLIITSEKNPIVIAQVVSVNPKEEWLKEGDLVFLRKMSAQDFSFEFAGVKLAPQSAIVA